MLAGSGWRQRATYIGDIVTGEENLGNGLVHVVEQAVPETHETALTDGSQSLELSKMLGALVNIHAAKTNTDGSGGDDDNSVALLAELDCSVDNQSQNRQERLMCLFIDNRTGAWFEEEGNVSQRVAVVLRDLQPTYTKTRGFGAARQGGRCT